MRAEGRMQLVERQDTAFAEVVGLIQAARQRAYQAVNTALVDLYWQVGEYVSRRIAAGTWGEGTVDELARYIAERHPDIRGFTRRNLYRMRQFHETYRDDEKLAPLVRLLPWTHNIIILSKCVRPEEREFYIRLAQRDLWDKRRLEREIDAALFERQVLSPAIVSPVAAQLYPSAPEVFRDTYVLDLLFFHRGLQCLVVFELKIDDFKPEYLGKLEFYLEALDRDVRKPNEKPSVGVLLCKSKDSEVVEYALSRSLSPAVVAQYQTQLPEKNLLQRKLHEFYELETERRARDGENASAPRRRSGVTTNGGTHGWGL